MFIYGQDIPLDEVELSEPVFEAPLSLFEPSEYLFTYGSYIFSDEENEL